MFRALVFLTVVAAAFAVSVHGRNLHLKKQIKIRDANLDKITAIINKMTLDDFLPPARKRVCEDADIQILVAYAKSSEFQTRLQDIANLPQTQNLIDLVLNSGADISKFLNFIQSFLDCGSATNLTPDQQTLYNLLETETLEVIAPVFHTRLQKEADLVKLLNVFIQGQGAADLKIIAASAPFKALEADLTNKGADQARCFNLLYLLTGLKFVTLENIMMLNVNDVLADITALLNKMTLDALLPPSRKRVCEDADIQILVAYAKTPKFQQRIQDLVNLPEIQDLFGLVLASGANVTKFTDFLQSFLNCGSSLRKMLGDDADDLYKDLEKVTLEQVSPIYHTRLLKEADLVKLLNVFNQGKGEQDWEEALKTSQGQAILNDIADAGADKARCCLLLTNLTGIPIPKEAC